MIARGEPGELIVEYVRQATGKTHALGPDRRTWCGRRVDAWWHVIGHGNGSAVTCERCAVKIR